MIYQWDKIMGRTIITMDEPGTVSVLGGEIWMNEMELTDLFGVIVPTVRAAIRAVYKSDVLKEYEAQKYIRLENGYYADVYSFPMVVTLAFRINSYGAQYLIGKDVRAKRKNKHFLFAEYQRESFKPAIIIEVLSSLNH